MNEKTIISEESLRRKSKLVTEGYGKEQGVIRKQLFKNMLHNLIAFTIIFTIFGAVIYSQVRYSVYANVEKELLRYQNTEINIRRPDRIIVQERAIKESSIITNNDMPFGTSLGQLIGNPKVIYILRDKGGKVINRSKYRNDL